MSSLNGKSIRFAKLHGVLFIPNVGNIGPTLSSTASGSEKATPMRIEVPFLVVTVIEPKTKHEVEVFVPLEFVTHLV